MPYKTILKTLLVASLLFAFINTVAAWRRTAVLEKAWKQNPDELSAQWVAQQIDALNPPPTIALLLSHRNPNAIWFDYRLHYLVLPKNFDLFWDALPQNTNQHFDLIVTYGAAQTLPMPAGLQLLARTQRAALYASASYHGLHLRQPHVAALPYRLLSVLLGLISLEVLGVCGWCALRAVSPTRFMSTWWGELALAHLIGAAMLACCVSPITFITQHLALWEGYVGLGIGLLITWGGARLFGKESQKASAAHRNATTSLSLWKRTFNLAAWGIIVLAFGVLIWQGLAFGIDWDGYSIWQLKAKAFVTMHGSIAILHDPTHFFYAHLDYPLLVPLQTWWTCTHAGFYSERWAQCIGLL